MEIISTAFENGNPIPVKYTKKGDNIPPPLKFKDVPENTKNLALIVDDPGGPLITFAHWIVWNIPPNITEISKGENITYPQGKNSFKKQGYLGPCPPYGKHKYFFKLYALDTMLDLNQGATKKKIIKAMSGHIIAEAQLIGTFQK